MRIYLNALERLNSYIFHPTTRQLDTERPQRTRRLLAALGNPHEQVKCVHITGTKGKGSVAAMIAAMLHAADYKVGLFTSPHLQDIRERFQIDGRLIGQENLADLIAEIDPVAQRLGDVRWQDFITTLALLHFSREAVDIAVIEVALGGRHDATNVITPLISVITNISYDHTDLLGSTLTQIAEEKAGIIKVDVPVVSAPQPDEAQRVIERVSTEHDAPLIIVGRDWLYEVLPPAETGQRVKSLPAGEQAQIYTTPLIGGHQAVNLAVAVATVATLQSVNFDVPQTAMHQGLRSITWRGRLELVPRIQPITLLDSAHNAESMQRLCETLTALYPAQPLTLTYGSKGSKDIAAILNVLMPHAENLILTQLDDPPTLAVEKLGEVAMQMGTGDTRVELTRNLGDAIELSQQITDSNGVICITGSVYIVGAARSLFGLPPSGAFDPGVSRLSPQDTG